MKKLSQSDIGCFMTLFNRGGYVLDFTTSSFDAFTMQSIDCALCQKYGLSKGKSLEAFLHNCAEESRVIKLLTDLFEHYVDKYKNEYENSEVNHVSCYGDKTSYKSLYIKCKAIIDRLSCDNGAMVSSTNTLKKVFSSEYLAAQISIMVNMQDVNPTEAIGKAKELIESCCFEILQRSGTIPSRNWDLGMLCGKTCEILRLLPENIPESAPAAKAIKGLLGNLRAIAGNIATIRNQYGSGHGKDLSYKGLDPRCARLVVGSSVTLCEFLWKTFEKRKA